MYILSILLYKQWILIENISTYWILFVYYQNNIIVKLNIYFIGDIYNYYVKISSRILF